ncbi:MAG: hypothetical protein FWE16_01820 [Firmicutes bacterium]|nr:hypothetical protein [Bacillota bacterium]
MSNVGFAELEEQDNGFEPVNADAMESGLSSKPHKLEKQGEVEYPEPRKSQPGRFSGAKAWVVEALRGLSENMPKFSIIYLMLMIAAGAALFLVNNPNVNASAGYTHAPGGLIAANAVLLSFISLATFLFVLVAVYCIVGKKKPATTLIDKK